jgi:hypothetical protein
MPGVPVDSYQQKNEIGLRSYDKFVYKTMRKLYSEYHEKF